MFTFGRFSGVAAFAVDGLASFFTFIGGIIGVIVSAVGVMFTPLGLVVAAIAVLGGCYLYSIDIAGQAVEYLKSALETLNGITLGL